VAVELAIHVLIRKFGVLQGRGEVLSWLGCSYYTVLLQNPVVYAFDGGLATYSLANPERISQW